ncbi:amino acid permease/ SLC12A domain-containing protein [Dactylonectria macrodidyma]|uniref:Amino acid permease/ SLC12A domain-containing protein n=1 Tax=Dactylonectria macrodidyma TaxID=307937 RepID=A0A9P9EPA6_9HYPO|nr:amino acid permease/ SLC12A domain-containing protein [Dactylonectria macrodidyma]
MDPQSEKADDSLEPTRVTSRDVGHVGESVGNIDNLQRRLGNRQIQLIAIGGSIGTGLFINIGTGLAKAGPGNLLIGFIIYCCFMALVNNCMAEMATLMPVSGGFIRMAGKWVDSALGFMVGWNFFVYEAILIPFEITALSVVLGYWRDNIPSAAVTAGAILLYGISNVLAVNFFGEAEFWFSGGKVILVFMLFGFTFFTMVGVNPQRDAYGFRYWSNPGAFAEWHSKGDMGRFEGFLNALWVASFIVVGPEYLSMTSAEAKLPRIYVKASFKTVYWRFALFFIGGALTTGIVVPYNDEKIQGLVAGTIDGGGTATASPYVAAMNNLEVGILPDITNALLFTSIFSAGNTYTFCAIRSLYGMALEGRAPKIFTKCTKDGVPIYCFALTMLFPFLAFLQESSGTLVVLQWFVNLVTAGCVINYIVICITYIRFHRACVAQGVDRESFPYRGWFQPYGAWIGLCFTTFVVFFYGYSSFTPWDVGTFFCYYAMVILAAVTYTGWKIIKRSKVIPAAEVDLVWEKPAIDAYEAICDEIPQGFWTEIIGMLRWSKKPSGERSA